MEIQQLARNLFSKPTTCEKLQQWIPFKGNFKSTSRDSSQESNVGASRVLGLASIGIGLAEIAAPRQVQRLLGIDDKADQRGTLRVLGVRELMHGVSLLAGREPRKVRAGVWSRVAGDALDSVLLSAAATKTRRPAMFAAVTAMVLAIAAADALCAMRSSKKTS
ncbi:MAG TPA: hypothetical protein VGK58_14445 [Lacipirellulaceae bacterium]